MNWVESDFIERSAEIEVYFRFVFDVLDGHRMIDPPMDADDFERFKKTIKANGFLLLYNLVEATVSNAVEAIFDELRTHGIRFNDCRIEVQHVILCNLRRHNVGKIHPKLTDISLHVVTETFRKNELFSGNVDARKIKATAKEFGFQSPNKSGSKLLSVKNARNDLAHGNKSFAEVGRDNTHQEMEETKIQVVDYLTKMLECVSEYLTRKEYLAIPPTA